jgi:hypothetical protein
MIYLKSAFISLAVCFHAMGIECGQWGYNPYDFNRDCVVDFADMAALADDWFSAEMLEGKAADVYTLQQLIDDTPVGGEVVLAGGIYQGSLIIDKDIHLRGASGEAVIIDAAGTGSASLVFDPSVTAACLIEGIEFINGEYGAIQAHNAKAVIRNCVFSGAQGRNTIEDFDGLLDNCIIENNQTPSKNGLIVLCGGRINGCIIRGNTISSGNSIFAVCSAVIENNLIYANTAGAATFVICDGIIRNNTITDNSTPSGTWYGCEAQIYNNIDWGNTQGGIKPLSGFTSSTANYCVLETDSGGEGNIIGSPGFADPGQNDYRLGPDSVCIDAAQAANSPFYDIEGDTRGTESADIGAYEYNTVSQVMYASNLSTHEFGDLRSVAGSAVSGDILEVYPGISTSTVIVNHDIVIRSVAGPENTVMAMNSTVAFNIAPAVTNLVIKGIKVTGATHAVYARGNGGLIDNCIFTDCVGLNLITSFSGTVRGCTISDNICSGGSLITSAEQKYCDLINNVITDNDCSGSDLLYRLSGLCENNIITRNSCSGIFYQFEGIIRNNTIADNILSGAAVKGGKGDFVNNIVWSNGNCDFIGLNEFSGSQVFPSYCNLDSYAGRGYANMSADPLFESGTNCKLTDSSPVINKGFAVNSPKRDINGNLRVGNPDIGAYEYSTVNYDGAVFPYKYTVDKTGDINKDNLVDASDLRILADSWLECTDPGVYGCSEQWVPPMPPYSAEKIDSLPPRGLDWTEDAIIVQPWGVSVWDILAYENIGNNPEMLRDTYGINTIIINPLEAHNRVGQNYYLEYQEFLNAISRYREAGFKIIIYSSIIHSGHFSTWESGLLDRLFPLWQQRSSNGATCNTYGHPWLSPATDGFDYTLAYAKQLIELYQPDAIMLDNSQLMWGRDVSGNVTGGPTDYSDGAQNKFREYLENRYGDAVETEFGVSLENVSIPDENQTDTKLYRIWMDWRNRHMAETLERFRAEIHPVLLFANTAYEYKNWHLATDMQLRHEDIVLSETRGKVSRDITLKLMLGKALGEGRPIWNYLGTFEDNINYLKPPAEIARMISATLARLSNPWLVYYGFSSYDTENGPSRDVIAEYFRFRSEHPDLYEDLTSYRNTGYIFSTRDHKYRGYTHLSATLRNLQAAGIVMDGIEDIYLGETDLSRFDVIMMDTESRCLSQEGADVIIDFVESGGRFVAYKDAGDYDELGFERSQGISILSEKLGLSENEISGVSQWWNSNTSSADHAVGSGYIHLRGSSNVVSKVTELSGNRFTSSTPGEFVELFPYKDNAGSMIVHTMNHDYSGTALSGWSLTVPDEFAGNIDVDVYTPESGVFNPVYSRNGDFITVTMPDIKAYSVLKISSN